MVVKKCCILVLSNAARDYIVEEILNTKLLVYEIHSINFPITVVLLRLNWNKTSILR